MNVLDENIADSQRQLLSCWRIKIRQIGYEISYKGIKDEEIIPLLHQIGTVTFFSRDLGFYHRKFCHPTYCLVCLAVGQYEVANFIRRFLRHPTFDSQAKRMGKVVLVTHRRLRMWKLYGEKDDDLSWVY
ncbi:MAG: hypothetical protein V1872_13760 [bacterium]